MVESSILPHGRFDLDLILGTNPRVAPREPTTVWLATSGATNDGLQESPIDATGELRSWLVELKRRSGLPYAALAGMIGVERRSVYFWMEGRPISPKNRSRVAGMYKFALRIDGAGTAATAVALRASYPTMESPAKLDRLADARVHEGDRAAKLPYFDVATLMSTGDATVVRSAEKHEGV
jgi:hypothetical protein